MAWIKLTDHTSGKELAFNTVNIARIEPVKTESRDGSYIAVVGRESNYQVQESTDWILDRLRALGEKLD